MRPTVTEQLHHIGRILERTVAPAVDDPYAAEILRRLIVDVRKLESCWHQAEPFMLWDIAELQRLLHQAAEHLPGGDRRSRIDHALAEPDAVGPDALSHQQQNLRALLAEAVPDLARTPEGDKLLEGPVLDYFTDRLARDPMANRAATTHV